jgi:hypothetical protein
MHTLPHLPAAPAQSGGQRLLPLPAGVTRARNNIDVKIAQFYQF